MATDRARAVRAAARGLVAAMAMSGFRNFGSGASPEDPTPPEAILTHRGPDVVQRLPEHQRMAAAELLHWGYGAAAGAVFGLLPQRVRHQPAAGPAYGLAIWLAFEAVIGPLMGIPKAASRPVLWRALIAADHVLYGTVVAGRLAPEPASR